MTNDTRNANSVPIMRSTLVFNDWTTVARLIRAMAKPGQ